MSGEPGPGVPCMVRSNASWVMVKWGPLLLAGGKNDRDLIDCISCAPNSNSTSGIALTFICLFVYSQASHLHYKRKRTAVISEYCLFQMSNVRTICFIFVRLWLWFRIRSTG